MTKPRQRAQIPFVHRLLLSAILLAFSHHAVAFTYEYQDRYSGAFSPNNAWNPVRINDSNLGEFTGDYLVGYRGYSSEGGGYNHAAVYVAPRDEVGGPPGPSQFTVRGSSLTIVERPDETEAPLNNYGLYVYTAATNDESRLQFDTTLNIDLQSFKNARAPLGHGAIVFLSDHPTVTLNVTTHKPVNVLFYSTAELYSSSNINTYAQGIRSGGSVNYTAKDVVDVKMILVEQGQAYGLNNEAKNYQSDAIYTFEKDASVYVQAQKGGGSLYGARVAGFVRQGRASEGAKAVLANLPGSTFRVDIETKNEAEGETAAYGIMLTANSKLDLRGKTVLTFTEDPSGSASYSYDGIYGKTPAGTAFIQDLDSTLNELSVKINAPKATYLHGTNYINEAGGEFSTVMNKASYEIISDAAESPYGINLKTINAGSKQRFEVRESLSIDMSPGEGIPYPVYISSADGGSTDGHLNDVALKVTGRLWHGFDLRASGTSSSSALTITGRVNADISAFYNESALFYARSTNNAESSRLDFLGGGTLSMPGGTYLMESVGQNALIHAAPTIATQLSGVGVAHEGGKLDLHLSSRTQVAQMLLYGDRETDSVVDVKLENGALWKVIGGTSLVDQLTLNAHGWVDLREAAGEDGRGSLGQAFLRTKTLSGESGRIALNVNTATNLGQILVIEEASSGEHQVLVANAPGATATGVPIKIIESVGGQSSTAFQATFKEEVPVEVGELRYYVVKTEEAKAMYAALSAEEDEEEATPETAARSPVRNMLRARSLAATTADENEEEPSPSIITDINADDNPNNWYLAPRRGVMPDFTDTAKGAVSTAALQYLAGLLPLETLRERLGDIHTFRAQDQHATPWVKMSATEWRVKPRLTAQAWDINFSHVKVGVDVPLGEKSLVGGYLSYTDFDSQQPSPAAVKGNATEAALYWSALSESRAFSDLVLRVGYVDSQYDTADTQGQRVKAKDIDNRYWGLTWNAGKQVPLNTKVVLEPSVLLGYTRFGASSSVSSSGLKASSDRYQSLLSMVGGTLEGRFATASGAPFTVYAKLFWEKEWLAHTDIVFNGGTSYRNDFKDHRWVYGLGLEGLFGRGNTWHVDLERSTGGVFQENWQLNAGLRLPW